MLLIMKVSPETHHRALLTVALPANEGRLRKHLWHYSAKEAFEFISTASADQRWLAMALARSRSRLERFDAEQSLELSEKLGLEIHHPNAFPGLQDLEHQAPWLIFSKGSLVTTRFSAVVGTRQASDLGVKTAQQVVSSFESSNLGVKTAQQVVSSFESDESLVSGGANGIDMASHNQAKQENKYQLMVVSSGLHTIFPISTKRFVDSGFFGAVISEQPPLLNSGKIGFLNRNRLIAALAEKLFLIEAPVVSGSINTAQHALSLGRMVYCAIDENPNYSPGGAWLARKSGTETIGTVGQTLI